ncbi:MAG TPA: hypothetical protein VFB81_09455, partial [Myxococcales bacterium]|nr:hypothetical protein [Myxococcales bacterium]
MRRTGWFTAAVLAAALYSSTASAGVWFEVLYAPCLTGNATNIGALGDYKGSIDCFNNDFNGPGARTLLSIKAFQVWEYGTMFLYYDVTGPWNSPVATVASSNEKGGFFGGITVTVSPLRVASKIMNNEVKLPFLRDLEIKYEMEHVAKFGELNYYGLQWSIDPGQFLDFLTITTVIRDDFSFNGVDLQLGGAWQKSFSLGSQDFIFGGFLQWGVFGEGDHVMPGPFDLPHGYPFFIAQPQFMYDVGKL